MRQTEHTSLVAHHGAPQGQWHIRGMSEFFDEMNNFVLKNGHHKVIVYGFPGTLDYRIQEPRFMALSHVFMVKK